MRRYYDEEDDPDFSDTVATGPVPLEGQRKPIPLSLRQQMNRMLYEQNSLFPYALALVAGAAAVVIIATAGLFVAIPAIR